jgi:hypothetical protein
VDDLFRILSAFPGATFEEIADSQRGTWALAYGMAGHEVFPLRGKVPAIAAEAGGHGVLDATTDLAVIAHWWAAMAWANIGGRVPEGVAVLDLDPRSGAFRFFLPTASGEPLVLAPLEWIEAHHGPTVTRTSWSGRRDGGRHWWFRHPGGALRAPAFPGWDLKTRGGYVVLPPSVHPDSGHRYVWEDVAAPIEAMPDWLAVMVRKSLTVAKPRRVSRSTTFDGDSIADWFSTTRRWHDVLDGWDLVGGDGDADGSKWKHPTATHAWSATVKHGCLFVYSPNTTFDVTDSNTTHGYTRFRAWAVLHHDGDLSAAARAAREMRGEAA